MSKYLSLLLMLVCAGSGQLFADPYIQVIGLFKHTAIVNIDGQQRLLKIGDESPEGVSLVDSNAEEATLAYRGRMQTLALSRQINTQFTAIEKKQFAVRRDLYGHYKTDGYINGKKVHMLLDTGASFMAMNSSHAQRLGINYVKTGQRHQVATASGLVDAFSVVLDKVEVGGIEVRNVRGSVVEGAFPRDILLGMTYLNHVDMRETAGIMHLEARF